MFTEKSTQALTAQNAYRFKVSINANKIEIKKAVEKIFSVDVIDVNTIRMAGKPKRMDSMRRVRIQVRRLPEICRS